MRNINFFIYIMLFVVGMGRTVFALTTEEMLDIKKTGLSENVIVYMLEHNYKDVGKVIKLKKAGLKDSTILAVIKNETLDLSVNTTSTSNVKKNLFPKHVDFRTHAKVKIVWYRTFHGKPLVWHKLSIDDSQVSIASKTIQLTWREKDSASSLGMFQKEPFESPFYWDLNDSDVLGIGDEGYKYMLRTGLKHQGRPYIDSSHYWVVLFEPQDLKLIDFMKNTLTNK